ncbi:MAG: 16S rRNA (guanine(527)-N(7))-methyltransferase RsmG [Pseudomonadota bacterium]
MELILKYFPNLSASQQSQMAELSELYQYWNSRINVISRKDIDNLYPHHVLHSLSIARMNSFISGSQILDLGTGGGFPGIPLAILFPDVQFMLIDGTAKKIKVVQAVADTLGLQNVEAKQQRAEELKDVKFDFVVSRAVATIDKLVNWSFPLIHQKHKNALPNGLIALKGGMIKQELKLLPKGTYSETEPLTTYFKQHFFEDKYLVYVQR